MERRNIQKRFYLETRADVLLKNREVFAYWRKLGLRYLFLGLEAIDAEGLKLHRKRVSMGTNNEALEVARSIGVKVAINLIADPSWDKERFAVVREWAMSIPDIVHLTVATPYPGTELWLTESRKLTTQDYRLFDIQHAVLPTTLPLHEFYSELVETQRVIARKHLGVAVLRKAAKLMGRLALEGQFNFIQSIWKFNKVYNADRQFADHQQPVVYQIRPPQPVVALSKERSELYIHPKTRRTAGGGSGDGAGRGLRAARWIFGRDVGGCTAPPTGVALTPSRKTTACLGLSNTRHLRNSRGRPASPKIKMPDDLRQPQLSAPLGAACLRKSGAQQMRSPMTIIGAGSWRPHPRPCSALSWLPSHDLRSRSFAQCQNTGRPCSISTNTTVRSP